MEQSAADPFPYAGARPVADLAGWKVTVSAICSVLLGVLFLVSGGWKLSDPFRWSEALTQFLVPGAVAMPFTLVLGIGEILGAILIVVPRYRRLGAVLIMFMLAAFMAYMGINYGQLAGKDCSCFPLVKRTIGPMFFISDALMLVMAIAAAVWSEKPDTRFRPVLVFLGAILVFAGVSYGINANQRSGLRAPDSITVNGQPASLQQGHIFLFFYDPECMHCDAAARRMSKLNWKDTRVIGIPTRMPQFAEDFQKSTGLQAAISSDVKLLRQTFKFIDPPYGVALDNGRQIAVVSNFVESEPADTVKRIGYAQ
jgi:uncharacterized membrane protein YphA (DoxX/SURF4 family)